MTTTHPQAKAHYPLAIRALIELHAAGELPALLALDVEPQYGHVARLTYAGGIVRFVRGTGLSVNQHGASLIAEDKGYSKFFLQRLGYQTPPGQAFLLPDYRAAIDKKLARHGIGHARIEEIHRYIAETIGYPCYVKPNDGSLGNGVYRCENDGDLDAALESYAGQQLKLVLVEKEVPYDDFRVVVLEDRAVACYRRVPLALIGDGAATIGELLAEKNRAWLAQGRPVLMEPDDQRIVRRLARHGYTPATVLARGCALQVADIANLSAGGSAEDCSARIHQRWAALCVAITQAMGLRFCGVDLACADIADPAAAYAILEINDSPGMDNFAALGPEQAAKARAIYRTIFNHTLPGCG